jgi:hypothetical protein
MEIFGLKASGGLRSTGVIGKATFVYSYRMPGNVGGQKPLRWSAVDRAADTR